VIESLPSWLSADELSSSLWIVQSFFLFILAESWIFVIYGENVTDVSMPLWYFTYVYDECAGTAAKYIFFKLKCPECENPVCLQVNTNEKRIFLSAVLKLLLLLASYNKNQQDTLFTFNLF
jgi:hypothetical protein